MKKQLWIALMLFVGKSYAQEYFPNNESTRQNTKSYIAFVKAKLFVDAQNVQDNATLLILNGKVVKCGQNIALPPNTKVVDLNGKYIYPSFIDLYTDFGTSKPAAASSQDEVYDIAKRGFYWNEHVKPQVNAFENFKYDNDKAKELLKIGFGTVVSHISDGIARGSGVLVALNNANEGQRFLENKISQHFAFTRSQASSQEYPSSLMGMIALLRQMYYDAKWYKSGQSTYKDQALEALIRNENLVQIFDASDKLNDFQIAKIAKEFGVNYLIKAAGNEFESMEDLKKINPKMIVPIAFPSPFDISNPYIVNQLEYKDMLFWNQAPSNLKSLSDAGIEFSITTNKLKKIDDFFPNLQKAIQFGFDKQKALMALTTIPAKLIGKSNELGSLNPNCFANFLITSGDIFDPKTIIYENWVQGEKFQLKPINTKDFRGSYALQNDNLPLSLTISGSIDEPKFELSQNEAKWNCKGKLTDNWVELLISNSENNTEKWYKIAGYIDDDFVIHAKIILDNGTEKMIESKRISTYQEVVSSAKVVNQPDILPVKFPNMPFGFNQKAKAQTILIKNATIWTNEAEGILEQTDVLVKNGKIAKVAKNISEPQALVIDGTGKHLTSGIIDEHSHIAIFRGLNEGGHNSSAEVSIQDVVNPEDIDIYRNLAGGVTTAQLLHGSSNPIGGQSAIIKLKWGENSDGLLFKNQPKFIKFALGENVKQSNWGGGVRFPYTRMGVEQVFVDYFQRAKEYDLEWKNFGKNKKTQGKQPRVDLELQTLAEILNKERFITCHSYVQSEILMMMQVAEKFGFNVNTFTHILEGYKVANQMKKHGVGASTFSDWWAYKFEVNDAIPQNGAIMSQQGVTVAYNSDDAEMSRRLNQEAAKAVKYGNVSPEDAWKFVTLNPAKLLHIDNQVGSVKVGKDADLVLWSNNPLSVYTKAEKTIIDGAIYFDLEKDIELRNEIKNNKSKLANWMISEKNGGTPTQAPAKKEKIHNHCDTKEVF